MTREYEIKRAIESLELQISTRKKIRDKISKKKGLRGGVVLENRNIKIYEDKIVLLKKDLRRIKRWNRWLKIQPIVIGIIVWLLFTIVAISIVYVIDQTKK